MRHAGVPLHQLIACAAAVACACRYTVGIEALLIGHEDWVHSVEWAAPPPGQPMHTRASVALLSASMDRTMIMWTYEVRMHACMHAYMAQKARRRQGCQQHVMHPPLQHGRGGTAACVGSRRAAANPGRVPVAVLVSSCALCSALRMRRPPTACGSTRRAWATQAAAAWATLEACSGQAARPSWRTATQVRRR